MRTAVSKIQILNWVEIKKVIISQAFIFLCGFLFSRTVLFDLFMPFGFSLVCSLSIYHIFSGLFGVVLGSLITANGFYSAYYIGLSVVACAIKLVCLNIYEKKNSCLFSLISCAVCNCFGVISLLLSVTLTSQDLIRLVGFAFVRQ